jgi:TldD protein
LVEAEREAADRQKSLTGKPADIGRYDIVYSAAAMTQILGSTLVRATELDRALGYEANATGTSYLGPDPMKLLGTPVASPVVTVMCERSTSDAVATVKWDDEGVTPETFALVKKGVLVDYQTTREQAAWIAPWYQKQGRAVASHGCAGAPSAGDVTMQHTPNIVLEPSVGTEDEESLIAQMEHGLYVPGITVYMDFQCSSGFGLIPGAFEVRNGKRAAVVNFASGTLGTVFRSADFWKDVTAVGGAKSAAWFDGPEVYKGEPGQGTGYSLCAVPALVKGQAIIDPAKKA